MEPVRGSGKAVLRNASGLIQHAAGVAGKLCDIGSCQAAGNAIPARPPPVFRAACWSLVSMAVRQPIWIRRVAAPGAEAFAVLYALESFSRAILTSILPLQALALLGEPQSVSLVFFLGSLAGLFGSLLIPWLVRRTARRYVYSGGALLLAAAALLLAFDGILALTLGLACRVLGVVALTIGLSLYIMDVIARHDLAHSEPLRMLYSATAWTIGPALGVWLQLRFGAWLPLLLSAATSLTLFAYFWFLRLTETPVLTTGRANAAPGALQNIRRFASQPRLVLAWLIATGRNCWWSIFYIFTPIYAVTTGLGEMAGGLLVSIGTGTLFLMPLWGRVVRRFGLRRVFITGFTLSGVMTLAIAPSFALPWLGAGFLMAASVAMVVLDACGNRLFFAAVHGRERGNMTAVYSTYRDAADLVTPGTLGLVLRVFDLSAVFVIGGFLMFGVATLARRIHPRVGAVRPPAPVLTGVDPAPRMADHPAQTAG
jgi:MFS family permease